MNLPKLIVFDFDLTILRIHSWAERVAAEDVPHRDLDADVADAAFFRAFVERARARDVPVAVASFGAFETIKGASHTLVPIRPRRRGERRSLRTFASVSIPALDAFELHLTPLNSTPTFAPTERPRDARDGRVRGARGTVRADRVRERSRRRRPRARVAVERAVVASGR